MIKFSSVNDAWAVIACKCRKVACDANYWNFYWKSGPWIVPTRTLEITCEMEPMAGIEPATDGLRNRCSTAELHWLPTTYVIDRIAFETSSPDLPADGLKFCSKNT